ncbi:MAG: TylF/MycF family methyltransferase [Gammaproteobacteria bacterium]|nr:TylF/MycF family methyltransferase [Gammaproteobacteria bacterium]
MKFQKQDDTYLTNRKELAEKINRPDMWELIDHWPLYVGLANLGRYMAIADLVQKSMKTPGHIAEFGSWKGANLMFMTKLLKLWDPYCNKVVHCFDSFEGLNTFSSEDGASSEQQHGQYAGRLDELKAFIDLYDLEDDVDFHVGLIQNTLPEFINAEPQVKFSLVYCDTDLYEPTQLILETLHERLMPGGFFVFDEWNDPRWPGEGIAGNEFVSEFSAFYEVIHVNGARQPNLILKRK